MKPGIHKKERLTKRPDVVEYLAMHSCTMPEAATRIGIGYKGLRGRLDKGQLITDIAANPHPVPMTKKSFEAVNEAHVQAYLKALGGISFTRAAHNAGLSIQTIRSRLWRGWPLEDAFTKPARPLGAKGCNEPKEACRMNPTRRLTYRMAADPVRQMNNRNSNRKPCTVRLTATPPKGF